VYVKAKTDNPKLGNVSATYATQVTCPVTCPFLHSGCYAENGFIGGFITKRLNRGVLHGLTPVDIAANEAAGIDRLEGDRDLRLHVVGDSPTIAGTKILADSARRYAARGGHKVWTYTHAWVDLPRAAWGPGSVLASCETEAEVLHAAARGYATALVVSEHPTDRLHPSGELQLLPCPEQTRGVSCAKCRLCMDDGRLRERRITIAFAAHGSRPSKAKALHAIANASATSKSCRSPVAPTPAANRLPDSTAAASAQGTGPDSGGLR
jgi:hypothetical protein